jgi:hypothetical protein
MPTNHLQSNQTEFKLFLSNEQSLHRSNLQTKQDIYIAKSIMVCGQCPPYYLLLNLHPLWSIFTTIADGEK